MVDKVGGKVSGSGKEEGLGQGSDEKIWMTGGKWSGRSRKESVGEDDDEEGSG